MVKNKEIARHRLESVVGGVGRNTALVLALPRCHVEVVGMVSCVFHTAKIGRGEVSRCVMEGDCRELWRNVNDWTSGHEKRRASRPASAVCRNDQQGYYEPILTKTNQNNYEKTTPIFLLAEFVHLRRYACLFHHVHVQPCHALLKTHLARKE